MYRIGINGTGAWGDIIWNTVACKSRKDIIFQLHNDDQCRAVARTFDNLAKVEFVDNPSELLYKINKDKTHYCQRILNELGDKENNCIPKVILTNDEINWAKKFLINYNNPIIVLDDVSGKHDKTNYRAHYVAPPQGLMQAVTDSLISKGYDVLQFGRKENNRFSPLKGAIHIRGLEIRQLLACYSIVSKGFFPDTGDYHAVLSVGSKCIVFHPQESERFGYLIHELHYLPELWKDEKIRVKYFKHQDYKYVVDNLEGIIKEL